MFKKKGIVFKIQFDTLLKWSWLWHTVVGKLKWMCVEISQFVIEVKNLKTIDHTEIMSTTRKAACCPRIDNQASNKKDPNKRSSTFLTMLSKFVSDPSENGCDESMPRCLWVFVLSSAICLDIVGRQRNSNSWNISVDICTNQPPTKNQLSNQWPPQPALARSHQKEEINEVPSMSASSLVVVPDSL